MEKEKNIMRPVRMENDLYEKAVKAAQKLGLSFSSYVRYLISKDTNK